MFIDSFGFMSSSACFLADNLAEELHNNKCNDCRSCLKYMKVKDEDLIFKCLKCNKNNENIFIKT